MHGPRPQQPPILPQAPGAGPLLRIQIAPGMTSQGPASGPSSGWPHQDHQLALLDNFQVTSVRREPRGSSPTPGRCPCPMGRLPLPGSTTKVRTGAANPIFDDHHAINAPESTMTPPESLIATPRPSAHGNSTDWPFERGVGRRLTGRSRDRFRDERMDTVIDPFGHEGPLGPHIEDGPTDEMQTRMENSPEPPGRSRPLSPRRDTHSPRKIAVPRDPSGLIHARYMPLVLNGIAMLPSRSSAIAPPSPPSAGTTLLTTSSAATASASPR